MAGVTVFVTGAGALVGQGVLRSLRMASRPMRIVTGDPDPRSAGHWLGDCAYRIPLAADPDFIARVEEVVARERVAVLIPGTDVELAALSRERPRLEHTHGVRVVVSPPHVVEIADDKWLTARFLEEHGLPFPRSALAADPPAVRRLAEAMGLPLFAKPRRGARSVGARLVRAAEELDALCGASSDLVVQEMLPEGEGEFTAGCLVVGGRAASVVVLRRDLRDGNTYRAYADRSGRFERRIAEIAERLGADGPCNLQFRVRDGDPVVFEINARFSGTTPIRAMFGFNEVAVLLDHLLDAAQIPAPAIRDGVVLRAWSDVLIAPGQLERLAAEGRLDHPRAEAFPFFEPRGLD